MTQQAAFDFQRRPRVPYWNTTPLTREQLAASIRTAEQQDTAVLTIFQAAGAALSPSQVWQRGLDHGRSWLLTSVRRSITNLTDAGALSRLNESRDGPYGRPEGLWRRQA